MRTHSPSLSTASQLSLPFGKRGWFLLTIFSSAFLLFLVQPMIARMALPRGQRLSLARGASGRFSFDIEAGN